MYLSITSSCIREIYHGDAPTTFSGSSSYSANTPESIVKKSRDQRKAAHAIPISVPSSCEQAAAQPTAHYPSNRVYKLNKSKIRKKMNAFFNLQATREFCAFFTITFPSGLSDDHAYQLFNLWLTRCRTMYSLKSYLWVAERQKNGTIHFHLLTNTRMPIREVCQFMRTALLPYCHIYNWEPSKIRKYNGIDVDNVWYPKRRNASGSSQRRTRDDAARYLGKYITKYVSKNNDTFNRLAWHESRDIAALFTAQNYDISECTPLLNYFRDTKNNWKKFSTEFLTIYMHPTVYNLTPYTDLSAVNEIVYNQFQDTG